MRRSIAYLPPIVWCGLLTMTLTGVAAAEPAPTGPETEKRFPPLKIPSGFKATLFACDPLIEYPSAIAQGPRPGSLFVVADFMTGLGTDIVRRDEIRLIEDTDGDGYADKATVYADGFNSIEGLTFHDGTVYAMHAPFLTSLRDTNGDGKADERRDLLTGLGLTPEENPVRLHCANGLIVGHDGWLYLALGDHGCYVKRPEGDRFVLEGGGILRCRPDGRDLHVFATGLRNIYDVALDDELNVFVRDNENDGGNYKIRVCHSFSGADHGYPYLYSERPEEALPPLADLGLGSSAGGLCYRERQFPAEYRGNLFFCEWGRSIVRYRLQPAGGRFKRLEEIEFASGAENDPYGFKPTDLVVDCDGSLLVADWGDGQRPKRGRGRIYRIENIDPKASGGRKAPGDDKHSIADLIADLDSDSYCIRVAAQEAIADRGPAGMKTLVEAFDKRGLGVRARLHAIWALARTEGPSALERLFELAENDPDALVQVQAVRAIADLTDPVLIQHRLDAEQGDAGTAARLAALAEDRDGPVLLEVIIAAGRLRSSNSPEWLRQVFSRSGRANEAGEMWEPFRAHATMQTLRRSGNWPAILKLLDLPRGDTIRPIALLAIADQAEADLVDGLIARLAARPDSADLKQNADDTVRRGEYAATLTRVWKKRGPWTYWGYRPAPRPANTVAWEKTTAIETALDGALNDPDRQLRLAVLRRMQREKISPTTATLAKWLKGEHDPAAVSAILESLREKPIGTLGDLLDGVVVDREHSLANRSTALALLAKGLDTADSKRLLDLARAVEDGPLAAELIRELRKHPELKSAPLLLGKLDSPEAIVRVTAMEALAELRVPEAAEPLQRLLSDSEPTVRAAAAAAAGRLGVRPAIEALLRLTMEADAAVRRASLDALRVLGEPRVVGAAVTALADRQTQMTALECICALGNADQAAVVIEFARRDPSADALTQAIRALAKWSGESELTPGRRKELTRAVAELQGQTGVLVCWDASSPLVANEAAKILEAVATSDPSADSAFVQIAGWRRIFASGLVARVSPPGKLDSADGPESRVWLAATDLIVAEPSAVQFLTGSAGRLQVWLDGRKLHQRDDVRAFQPDSDRFDGSLSAGRHRLLVRIDGARTAPEFQARFRRKNSSAELEQLSQAALARTGDAERGRKLFFDAEKVQCSKCHRIGDQGEQIGPELTGVADRFSRIHIVESILEPSRTVATGFQTIGVVLRDGRVLTGIKVADTETTLTLGDNQGKKHFLARTEIEEQVAQTQSTMPDGLVKQLSVDQFVDLITFLAAQKGTGKRPPAGSAP